MEHNRFPSSFKIKGKLAVKQLFLSGKTIKKYPLKAVYNCSEESNIYPKFGVSVPKKLFKKAVDRNQIKRWLRESIRLNLAIFSKLNNPNKVNSILVIYISREQPDFNSINKKVKEIFKVLCE